jgi:hypothetical protein
MTHKALSDWKTFYQEGLDFHKTVLGSLNRPDIFSPSLVQNVAAMCIEKYFMAIFMSHGALPKNHTMADFLEEAGNLFPIDPELQETLLYMDSLQQICSVEKFKITAPKATDVPRFVSAVNQVASLADKLCLAAG